MSFSTDTLELEQSLHRTLTAMQTLLQGLQARRAAWISAKPSLLAPSPELEQLTQQVAREESLRNQIVARIRATLPAPSGQDPQSMHVNITRIAAALPGAAARSLRDIADQVQRLAKQVRAEVTLGQRLVRFAWNTQPTAGTGAAARNRIDTSGYDRGARFVRGTRAAGAWIDGKA